MIQSINRALDILEFLTKQPETPRTLSQIAGAANLNPSTASNIIKTMAERNYVEQAGPRKGYVPGIMCNMLANEESFHKKLVKTAAPFMESLARKTGETVLIAVFKKNKRFILHQLEGGEALQVRSGLITDSKVFDTATGKVLLSNLTGQELKNFIAYSELENPEAQQLLKSLQKVREEGFTVHEIHNSQVAGIGFPVMENGRAIAALGLYLPVYRFRGKRKDNIIRGLGTEAKNISNALKQKKRGGR